MWLPQVLPDESLFSRICRYLALSGTSRNQSLQRLLGDGRAAVHPYLTAHLANLSRFTEESAGSLLRYQTLRPLFAYYLPRYSTGINDDFASSNDLIRACQLSTFREREHLVAKYCPECAQEDMRNYGVAYWHCTHQIPGLWACSKHNTWLVQSELPSRSHTDSHFFPNPSVQSESCGSLAMKFAEYTELKLNVIRNERSRKEVFSDLYRRELKGKGGLTNAGRVKRKALALGVFEVSAQLSPRPSYLYPRSRTDFRYFSSLLLGQYPQHPFKHLLLEFYLSQCLSDKIFHNNVSPPPSKELEYEECCCELLKSGLSMAAVSREIGKSRCYVKTIALKFKIPVNLKPKKMTDRLKESIARLAYKGFHRNVIAKRFGVSVGSIELIISTTYGLVEWRRKCKRESLKRRYKYSIFKFVKVYPNSCRQEVKKHCEAAFYWLYQHDPEWLELVLPIPQRAYHIDRVDWVARDKEIFQKVSEWIFENGRALTYAELDRRLGGHGWLTSKQHKLPITMKLLRTHRQQNESHEDE